MPCPFGSRGCICLEHGRVHIRSQAQAWSMFDATRLVQNYGGTNVGLIVRLPNDDREGRCGWKLPELALGSIWAEVELDGNGCRGATILHGNLLISSSKTMSRLYPSATELFVKASGASRSCT